MEPSSFDHSDHHEHDGSEFSPLLFRDLLELVVKVYRRNAWRLIAIALVAQIFLFVVASVAGEALVFDDEADGGTGEAGFVETGDRNAEIFVDRDETGDLGDLTDTSDPAVREALGRSDRSPDDALGFTSDSDVNLLGDVVVEETSGSDSGVFGDLEVNWLAAVISGIFIWVAFAVSEAAMTWVVLESRLNLRVPLAVSMRRAFDRLLPLALTTFVISLIILVVVLATIIVSMVVGPLAVMLGVVAGIYLAVRLLFAPIVALVRRTGPSDSINESFRMTRGNWWMVAGYVLVMVAFYLVVGTALQFTIGQLPVVGDILAGTVLVPPSIILITVLYLDLRARSVAPGTFTREVLAADLGLAESGPGPGTGTEPPSDTQEPKSPAS
jgi:hypothetical protein